MEKKFEIFETSLNTLKKCVGERDLQIEKLEERLSLQTVTINEENLVEKEICVEVELFKCNECEFESGSKKGLKVHETRIHGQKFKCDLCEKSFDSKRDQKIHTHTH